MPRTRTAELSENHNCDLFVLTSHHAYYADRSLSEFAIRGNRNIHGWGIGVYNIDRIPEVFKSHEPAFSNGNVSEQFASAMRTAYGRVILGHLRLTSRGGTATENNHPFELPFLGYNWLLVHNGTAQDADRLVDFDERILVDATSDTPRIFEFIRNRMIEHCASDPKHSLIEGCRSAYSNLLREDPGTFNLILSNGHLTFVLIHWRPFYMLHREKSGGDVGIVSTIRLNEQEHWIKFQNKPPKKAKMLVFSGPTLVLNGDIPT